MIPDWDAADVLAETLMGPRHSWVPLPDLRVVERPGWLQLVTPSFRDGSFNGISLSVLDAADADRVIDETLATYRQLGIGFRWAVPPDSRPADLADRLAARGLMPSQVRAMARSTAPFGYTASAAITVDAVDATNIETFTRVMAEAWETDPAPLRIAHDAVLAEPSRRFRLFLAARDGVPAGCASCCMYPRSTYLIGAAVLPRFRGVGVYRALIAARLRTAADAGIELATTQAMEATSAPMLERMGFETVARFAVLRQAPPALPVVGARVPG